MKTKALLIALLIPVLSYAAAPSASTATAAQAGPSASATTETQNFTAAPSAATTPPQQKEQDGSGQPNPDTGMAEISRALNAVTKNTVDNNGLFAQTISSDNPIKTAVALPTCSYCGKTPAAMKHCQQCKIAKYCDETCQKKHWKIAHKEQCKKQCEAIETYQALSSMLDCILQENKTPLTLLLAFWRTCSPQEYSSETRCHMWRSTCQDIYYALTQEISKPSDATYPASIEAASKTTELRDVEVNRLEEGDQHYHLVNEILKRHNLSHLKVYYSRQNEGLVLFNHGFVLSTLRSEQPKEIEQELERLVHKFLMKHHERFVCYSYGVHQSEVSNDEMDALVDQYAKKLDAELERNVARCLANRNTSLGSSHSNPSSTASTAPMVATQSATNSAISQDSTLSKGIASAALASQMQQYESLLKRGTKQSPNFEALLEHHIKLLMAPYSEQIEQALKKSAPAIQREINKVQKIIGVSTLSSLEKTFSAILEEVSAFWRTVLASPTPYATIKSLWNQKYPDPAKNPAAYAKMSKTPALAQTKRFTSALVSILSACDTNQTDMSLDALLTAAHHTEPALCPIKAESPQGQFIQSVLKDFNLQEVHVFEGPDSHVYTTGFAHIITLAADELADNNILEGRLASFASLLKHQDEFNREKHKFVLSQIGLSTNNPKFLAWEKLVSERSKHYARCVIIARDLREARQIILSENLDAQAIQALYRKKIPTHLLDKGLQNMSSAAFAHIEQELKEKKQSAH